MTLQVEEGQALHTHCAHYSFGGCFCQGKKRKEIKTYKSSQSNPKDVADPFSKVKQHTPFILKKNGLITLSTSVSNLLKKIEAQRTIAI